MNGNVYAVIDIETSGLSPRLGDGICEIGAVVLNERFEVERCLSLLLHPGCRMSWSAINVHRISDHAVRDCPSFREILPGFLSFLQGVTHLVAHNLSFETRFLNHTLCEHGVGVSDLFSTVCTMRHARSLKLADNARLATLMQHFGIQTTFGMHAALVDAAATSMLLQKMSGSMQFPGPRSVSVPSIGSRQLCCLPDPCVSRTSESDLRRLLQQMGLTAARADHVVPLNSLQ
ncbi:MAG: hypothetical protein RIT02_4294 [Planctomycetota bacterium]|jgi:DNA polymerase III epsilon subunit-like protein